MLIEERGPFEITEHFTGNFLLGDCFIEILLKLHLITGLISQPEEGCGKGPANMLPAGHLPSRELTGACNHGSKQE